MKHGLEEIISVVVVVRHELSHITQQCTITYCQNKLKIRENYLF